jgi:hypothetical protein
MDHTFKHLALRLIILFLLVEIKSYEKRDTTGWPCYCSRCLFG